MSDVVVSGIIEKKRLVSFVETFHTGSIGNNNTPLVQEAKLHFDGDGITARAVDSANVCMVGPVSLAPRGFEAYESPGRVTIGVSLSALLDKLGPAESDQLVEFEVDMETRHLVLRYGTTEISQALIDPESIREEPDVSDLDLPNTLVVEGSAFSHAVTVADMVSGHVTIEGRPDEREVRFYAEGDTDDVNDTLGDEDTLDGTKIAEAAESLFSLDYLDCLANPIPDDAEVTIQFGQEFPTILTWEAFDGEMEARQQLAPRIAT